VGKVTKKTNRNASPSAYGWNFHVGAGISLMLDNVKEFTNLKMEGKYDDIEITLGEGKKIYAQAKSVIQIGDQRNAGKKLNDALKVLSEDEQNCDAFKLVYITNIINPLSSSITSAFDFGRVYNFSFLPDDAKNNIKKNVNKDFPIDKFELHIIYFYGEGKNKFQAIKEKIGVFLRSAIDDPTFSDSLLESWFTTFMINASDKPDEEKEVHLTKSQVIYPLIAIIIEPPIKEEDFYKVCEYENYTEISQEFRKLITENTYDYEFISEVLGDYFFKLRNSDDKVNFKYEFTKNEWQNYEERFIHVSDEKIRQALIKILILTIILQNSKLSKIKSAANL
jgi:hypothetical protein